MARIASPNHFLFAVTPFENPPPYKIMGTYVMRALLTRRTRTEETVGIETENAPKQK